MLLRKLHHAVPFVLALAIACGGEEATHGTAASHAASHAAPPAVIEVHPLAALEQALADPATTRAEFWRLGTEVLGWDAVVVGDPAAIEVEEMRAWIAEDLRLAGIGDWPYETLYANHRGPASASQSSSLP
ncbi:MAG: hypothetical protein WD226_11960 [Planctomycetota bacterium]